MIFVILQAPNNGYYWLIKAGSNKHFELEDNEFQEIDSGEYYEMLEKINLLELNELTRYGTVSVICFKNTKNNSYSYHTEDDLEEILKINPDYLKDKEPCEDFTQLRNTD